MFAIAEFSKQSVPSRAIEKSDQGDADEALIQAIAKGDRPAMQTLYRRHHVRIYRFILRLTNDASLAEDLVSEVFIGARRHAGSFRSKSQVSTWLLAIARNKALSALGRRRDEQLNDDAADLIADPACDADTMIEDRERSAIIRKCLSQLSSDHREVIDLVYYHEKTVEEVAQIIHVPASTVKTRMFYARKRMEKLLTASGCSLH